MTGASGAPYGVRLLDVLIRAGRVVHLVVSPAGTQVIEQELGRTVRLDAFRLADLLGGAALVEAVMNLQGLGLLLLDAVRSLDIYLVMGSVLMGTVLLLLGNLLADIALVMVDPRVDFSSLSTE